ncbi:MAG TPA: single-stranded DNA-binding protein [bacterium]|nr:single-stranded DNA-binding protein [bacterium]
MFGDLNRVEIIGNVTQDLELRYTANGTAVTSFGIATNRRWKSRDSEEWNEETEFHNITVWANLAENLSQRVKKGTKIFVAGRLQTRSWEGQDGKKNYKTEIVAQEVILLDRYEKGPKADLPAPKVAEGGSKDSDTPPSPDSKKTPAKKSEEINPDDLPF